jgi:hypothetical protein
MCNFRAPLQYICLSIPLDNILFGGITNPVSMMFCWESFMPFGRPEVAQVPMVTNGGSCDMTPKYE